MLRTLCEYFTIPNLNGKHKVSLVHVDKQPKRGDILVLIVELGHLASLVSYSNNKIPA